MSQMQRRQIDGDEYEFSQMGAKESVRTLTKLFKLIGKPLMLGFGSYKGKDQPLDKQLLAEAVGALTERLDENEALEIIETLCGGERVLCNGKKVAFNSHYEGKLGHLFKVLWAAMEVQFGNFSDALPVNLVTLVNKDHQSTTPASATSTGASGSR